MKLTSKLPLIWLLAAMVMGCATVQAQPAQQEAGYSKLDERMKHHRNAVEKRHLNPETRKEMMSLRHQKATIEAQERLLKLKTALDLREEQMPAWNDYETYMLSEQQERHIMMSEMQGRRMENRTPPTSLELAEMNVQRLETQLTKARERLSVFTNLYSALDDEQKQKVDKLSHRKIKKKAKELRKMRKANKN